jgi:hypothetical protein
VKHEEQPAVHVGLELLELLEIASLDAGLLDDGLVDVGSADVGLFEVGLSVEVVCGSFVPSGGPPAVGLPSDPMNIGGNPGGGATVGES